MNDHLEHLAYEEAVSVMYLCSFAILVALTGGAGLIATVRWP